MSQFQKKQKHEVSVFDKSRMGGLMGSGVGLTIGFIFGSWQIMRHGAGPRGVLSTLSRIMLGSAASLGFFLSIGAVIRNDAPMSSYHAQFLESSPILVQTRHEGFKVMQARWSAERASEQK
ncbi:hypothetical protein CYLTODRAFT_399439 [Cylindrobasidium torrendii FP15055 ss-10]|uniref:Reactive mitochondrial oxygen species modulator 1-domain-containing protein n=1 Tax=Cylindrobasidium torrendii FP15055 ss-10 TaxID=1314674 RepID=A0A0D7B771_9AGAR|nr:hypothetical protein CYLTODRAFT_399439 [Cylindrobasidium torrendii FP15055 ss-10]